MTADGWQTGGLQRIELDTPSGRLAVTWPPPQLIYAEPLEPVAALAPADPEPAATLDGRPISIEDARQLLRETIAAGEAHR